MLTIVAEIEKVFETASRQKVWDQFSKAQRKSIISWKRQAMVCRITHSTHLVCNQLIKVESFGGNIFYLIGKNDHLNFFLQIYIGKENG